MNSDCLVMQNFDELFYLATDYAGVSDIWFGFSPYVNSGVFVMRPSLCLYYTLLTNMKRVSEYGTYYDQDYFNWMMKYKILRLSFNYNSLSFIFLQKMDLWNKELKSNPKIIHFTWVKPKINSPYTDELMNI